MCSKVIVPPALAKFLEQNPTSSDSWKELDDTRCELDPSLRPMAVCPSRILESKSRKYWQRLNEADMARTLLQERSDKLKKEFRPRQGRCGQQGIHLIRPREGDRMQNLLLHVDCKRFSCPHCWREKQIRSWKRASVPILSEVTGEGGDEVRVEDLHMATCEWGNLETRQHAVRRAGAKGYLRVCKRDGKVLIVADTAFPGSTPIAPAKALDRVIEAVEQLDPRRHSFRLLGLWSDSKAKEWTLLEKRDQLDLDAETVELEQRGYKPRRIRRPGLKAVTWYTDLSEFGTGGKTPKRPKSDRRTESDPEPDGRTPFDDDFDAERGDT